MFPVRATIGAALIAAAVVLQASVLSRLPLPGATPDLVLLVVVALAMGWGPQSGAGCGFAAGLLLDLAPPAEHAIGRWALVLGCVGYGAGLLSIRLRRSVVVTALVAAGAAVSAVLAYAATGAWLDDFPQAWRVANGLLPTSSLYAVVLSPFIVSPVLAVLRRLEPEL